MYCANLPGCYSTTGTGSDMVTHDTVRWQKSLGRFVPGFIKPTCLHNVISTFVEFGHRGTAGVALCAAENLSRNDAIGDEARPHPGPLPQERELTNAAPGKVTQQWPLPSAGKASPSPWGEGRGEGERCLSTEWFRLSRMTIFLYRMTIFLYRMAIFLRRFAMRLRWFGSVRP